MPAYFADYRWSNREPQGISPIDDPTGKEHFRLFDVDGGVRLEQFDRDGRFLRLVYCPQDRSRQRGATNKVSADRRYKIRRGDDGTVRAYEEFVWPEDRYSEGAPGGQCLQRTRKIFVSAPTEEGISVSRGHLCTRFAWQARCDTSPHRHRWHGAVYH